MSDAVAPPASFAGFAQQGQVDWVQISNKSVEFSVAVLARLARAGIDAFTLQVGRAICLNFTLDPVSQERIADAISKLRKYGSYADLIWFGFGVKHVVTDLAETEEGLTLVALCAALTTTYDHAFSARVVRQLCILQKAPESFTPALRQWKALVELCAGILTSSHFILVLNGFRRLMSAQPEMPDAKFRQSPTSYTELAAAILALARISKKNLVNATFTGGLDCAWLAALAEWVLSLDVGISNASGLSLYRSRSGFGVLPQVTIICIDNASKDPRADLLIRRAFVVSSGQAIHHTEREYVARHRLGNFVNWRSPWSTVLCDTFHGDADALLHGEAGRQFAIYMQCVSLLQKPDRSHRDLAVKKADWRISNDTFSFDPLLCVHMDMHGQEFIHLASTRLPELVGLRMNRPAITRANASQLRHDSLGCIGRICTCRKHQNKGDSAAEDDYCLIVTADTIIVFLWICLSSAIDDDVLPSITGLRNLYSWLWYSIPHGDTAFDVYPMEHLPVRGLELVFHVLTGISLTEMTTKFSISGALKPAQLARVGDGLCIYRVALEDPQLDPGLIAKFRVIRGYVGYSGARFSLITSMEPVLGNSELPDEHLAYLFQESPALSCEMVIQESDDETQLELAYRVRHLGADNQISELWLDLGILLPALSCATAIIPCAGGCRSLYNLETFPYAYYAWRNSLNAPLKIEAKAVDTAQQIINNMKDTDTAWILITTRKDDPMFYYSHATFFFTNNHLGIYIALACRDSRSWSLIPFTRYLSCITELGYWSRLNYPNASMPSKGEITLMTPSNAPLSFRWKTQGLEDKEVTFIRSVERPRDSSTSPTGSSQH